MLKSFIITLALICVAFKSNSQLLQGQWEGEFKDGGLIYPIYIEFILNQDTTYTVYSYSKATSLNGKDTVVVCQVYYELLSQDSVYLEEIEVVEPVKYRPACLQKMYLKIIRGKKDVELVGSWQTDSVLCNSSGIITFRRNKRRKA